MAQVQISTRGSSALKFGSIASKCDALIPRVSAIALLTLIARGGLVEAGAVSALSLPIPATGWVFGSSCVIADMEVIGSFHWPLVGACEVKHAG